jgi:hypothetical protein
VGRLLERGADASADRGAGTPLGWAAHGSRNWTIGGRDYVAVAERLAAAGNRIEAGLLEEADGPPYEWLAERLRTGA